VEELTRKKMNRIYGAERKVERQKEKWKDRRKSGKTEGKVERQKEKWKDRQKSGQTEGKVERMKEW